MLGVGLWDGAKGNSHMGKGHRAGASVYFGHMSSFLCVCVWFFVFFSLQFVVILTAADLSSWTLMSQVSA